MHHSQWKIHLWKSKCKFLKVQSKQEKPSCTRSINNSSDQYLDRVTSQLGMCFIIWFLKKFPKWIMHIWFTFSSSTLPLTPGISCGSLTLAGFQVPTKATLSFLSSAEQGRENIKKSSWIRGRERTLISYHQEQNSLHLGKLIEFITN